MTRVPSFPRMLLSLALLAGGMLAPSPGAGQAAEMCPEGRIQKVRIKNGPILDPASLQGRPFEWGWRMVDRLHFRTREAFIRSDLLFQEGTCYDPALLADSERALRGYRFIASASVRGIQDQSGDWTVHVTTRDEWSTQLNLDVSLDGRFLFQGFSVSEINLLGRGITSTLFYSKVDQSRNRGMRLRFPRVLDTRLDGIIAAGKTRTGKFLTLEGSYPFLGEVGKASGLQQLSLLDGYFRYGTGSRRGISHVLLPVEDRRAALTLARRWGEPGSLLEFGISLAHMELAAASPMEDVRIAYNDRFDELETVSDSMYQAVLPQAHRVRSTVAGALVSHRRIRFAPRPGLELIRGIQDVAVGTEGSLFLGLGVSGMDTHVSAVGDLLMGGRIFAGTAGDLGVLNLRASMEGRRARFGLEPRHRWRDVRVEAEALGYWTPSPLEGHIFGRLYFQGAWRVDQPYQSTLGGVGRLRGYFQEELPVGAGMVGSLEARVDLPGPEMVDVGFTAFFDGGRGWAEGVPFGRDTGWLSSLGGGIRFAFPSGSGTLLRLEGAWPMRRGVALGDALIRAYFVDLRGLLGLRGNNGGNGQRFNGYFNRLRGP